MTTHHDEPIVCECGHEGSVHWAENDQPFSQHWERYSLRGFEGGSFETVLMGLDEALEKLNPRCPKCEAIGKAKYK